VAVAGPQVGERRVRVGGEHVADHGSAVEAYAGVLCRDAGGIAIDERREVIARRMLGQRIARKRTPAWGRDRARELLLGALGSGRFSPS
jgi:hypothetical protein